MDDLRITNDIDKLYKQEIIKESGNFVCPVCKKVYKREINATRHMEEKDCYDIKDLFMGTQIERNAHELFQSMNGETNINMFFFRKNRSYRTIMKFVIFCITNEIHDVGLYFSFVQQVKTNCGYTNKILSEARKINTVREYRIFLHQNPEYIDTKEFLSRYRDDLLESPNFLIRSIEKAHISITELVNGCDSTLLAAITELPEDYYNRLEELYEKIG